MIYYARKIAKHKLAEEFARQAGLYDVAKRYAQKAIEYKAAEDRARESTKPGAVEKYARMFVKQEESEVDAWDSGLSNFRSQVSHGRYYKRRRVFEDAIEKEIRDVVNETEDREITEQIAREVEEQENRLHKAG
ncbi:hypothetical protein BCON_0081g00430 [Botryotinia convoluta]|uniref:Uncharacterized protein n=1 Tax=Botryotinia convoluta TaxID=54673 RepID=A0A4Z1I3F3_9HELO|nr:hypothetical protein BCON_0081g00430 [Botryotinia convoluta]